MAHQILWLMTMVLALAGMAAAAPPLDPSRHHDVKKSFPSEFGSDEEVRQLLNLKGLAAQRDLGNLKKQGQSGPTPAPDSASVSDDGNKGMTDDHPKKEETATKNNEGNKGEPPKTEETESGLKEERRHPEGDQQIDDRHMQLKRQQLYKQHVLYNPLDLALYVYKTGDEEGVTLAIQELIVDGLMTAQEALNYLREIRENLHYLNKQDEEQEEEQEEEANENIPKTLMKKSSMPMPLTEMSLSDPESVLTPEMDYDNLIDRLRGPDYVSTEYSLEEVIYQLAKILFKQAMHREGDVGSEKALQEVAALLEKEAARGAITPEVEKKVLDVMVNSLVDSISENEFPSGTGPVIGGPNFKLPSQSPFPLGNPAAMFGASRFKPSNEFFQLSKATTKREAPDDTKKMNDEKN